MSVLTRLKLAFRLWLRLAVGHPQYWFCNYWNKTAAINTFECGQGKLIYLTWVKPRLGVPRAQLIFTQSKSCKCSGHCGNVITDSAPLRKINLLRWSRGRGRLAAYATVSTVRSRFVCSPGAGRGCAKVHAASQRPDKSVNPFYRRAALPSHDKYKKRRVAAGPAAASLDFPSSRGATARTLAALVPCSPWCVAMVTWWHRKWRTREINIESVRRTRIWILHASKIAAAHRRPLF